MGMIAFLTKGGTTASIPTVSLTPPQGYKWRIKLAAAKITTSATTGSRTANIGLSYGEAANGGNIASNSLISISFTTVSSSTYDALAPFTGANAPSNQNYPDMEISAGDTLQMTLTLLSGDSGYLYLLVEELPDGV